MTYCWIRPGSSGLSQSRSNSIHATGCPYQATNGTVSSANAAKDTDSVAGPEWPTTNAPAHGAADGLIGGDNIAAMQVVATIASAMLGAGVGLLLPAPTYRLSVPADRDPAGNCPHCRATLLAGLRGWIGRGTCASCGNPLASPPWRFAAVAAVAFALLGWRLPHRSPAEVLLLAAWFVLAGAGIWLAAIDLRVQRLPRKIIAAAAAVCGLLIVAAALVGDRLGLAATAGSAALMLGLAYLAMALLAPGQIGAGDIRLAALCGLLLGTHGWGAVVLGAVLPWLLSAIVTGALLSTRRVHRGALIPFGPYLIVGTLLAGIIAGL